MSLRLKQDNLEEAGKLKKEVADTYLPVEARNIRFLKDKRHKSSLTCLVVHGQHLYTASKDAGLLKWDLSTGEKLAKVAGGKRKDLNGGAVERHCTAVNALAVTTDGKYLASGDDSKLIHVWDADDLSLVKTFRGHRDAVSGLAFRKKTHTLYSCSHDRSVKIWSLDEMAYVETL